MATNIDTNNYDANSIKVLEGLEAVRTRPGMYIGSVSTRGLNHLIYEIVDNSVESDAGRGRILHRGGRRKRNPDRYA